MRLKNTATVGTAILFAVFAMVPVRAADEAAKLVRAKKDFAVADAELNKTYKSLQGELDKTQTAELRNRQREWIEYRDYISADQPRQTGFSGDDPKQSDAYWEMMTGITKNRIVFLRSYSGKGLSKEITGVYGDSFGGDLELEETKAGIVFSLSVVRGPTSHTGDITGIARREGSRAFYKERLEPNADREPCELTFTFTGGHIVKIEGKNTGYYHGARAYFDGTYFKSGRLKKSIKLDADGR